MNINATLIGQSIAFAFFVGFCMKYVWPPLLQALHDRQKKIADGLAAADRATRDLALAQEKAGVTLQDAHAQAQTIIEQANQQAALIIDEAKAQAREEGNRLKQAATVEIEQAVSRAREALRTQVGKLAVAGAEKILGEHINAANNERLIDQFAAEL